MIARRLTRIPAAVAAVLLATTAPKAEGRQLHLACARGAAPVCRALLANPKLVPGLRLAIEQQLSDIEREISSCEQDDRAACRRAVERFPELPPPVMGAVRARLAR